MYCRVAVRARRYYHWIGQKILICFDYSLVFLALIGPKIEKSVLKCLKVHCCVAVRTLGAIVGGGRGRGSYIEAQEDKRPGRQRPKKKKKAQDEDIR